jgi:serine/threonine protein kinase
MCSLPSLIPDIAFSNFSQNRFELGAMEIMEELGSGAYGVVYKAKVTGTGEVVALKRLDNTFKPIQDSMARSAEKLNMFLEFWHEASILTYATFFQKKKKKRKELTQNRKLPHECIAALRGVCFEPLSMALEYVAGPSLYTFSMDRSKPISWKLVLRIARDLARALHFMHSQEPPIVHRDLKSPNGIPTLFSRSTHSLLSTRDKFNNLIV